MSYLYCAERQRLLMACFAASKTTSSTSVGRCRRGRSTGVDDIGKEVVEVQIWSYFYFSK